MYIVQSDPKNEGKETIWWRGSFLFGKKVKQLDREKGFVEGAGHILCVFVFVFASAFALAYVFVVTGSVSANCFFLKGNCKI